MKIPLTVGSVIAVVVATSLFGMALGGAFGRGSKTPRSGDALACFTNEEQAPKAPGAHRAPQRGRPRVAADAGEGPPPPQGDGAFQDGWYPV